jgi:hypothetical protein
MKTIHLTRSPMTLEQLADKFGCDLYITKVSAKVFSAHLAFADHLAGESVVLKASPKLESRFECVIGQDLTEEGAVAALKSMLSHRLAWLEYTDESFATDEVI